MKFLFRDNDTEKENRQNHFATINEGVGDLSKLIDLNENEADSIKYYNQGDALFVCGNRRMRIKILLTQEELDSFGSGGGL